MAIFPCAAGLCSYNIYFERSKVVRREIFLSISNITAAALKLEMLKTPSQRDPLAAQEERGVVIFVGSVSMKFGVIGSLLQVYRIFLPVRLKRFKPTR